MDKYVVFVNLLFSRHMFIIMPRASDTWIRDSLIESSIDNRLSSSQVKKVYEKLKEVARKGKENNRAGIIFYGEIMNMIGLDPDDPYDREQVLGRMLGGVSQHEKDEGRPLLSAIVVRKDGKMPGPGFYGFNNTAMTDLQFWIKEIRKVWNYWSTH